MAFGRTRKSAAPLPQKSCAVAGTPGTGERSWTVEFPNHIQAPMVELLVFIRKDASLARIDAIARELAAAGLTVKSTVSSLGVIVGTAEHPSLAADLKKIKDVVSVRERRQG
jgi:broad-specificity NMP kinase